MAFFMPVGCFCLCAFTIVGLFIGAALFVLFFVLFMLGYRDYLKVKHGKYVIYKQECTSIYSVTYTDGIVGDDQDKEEYAVFGKVGEYKRKYFNSHVPHIKKGEMYYLVVLQGSTKIFEIFSADNEIDSEMYSSADQYLYTPLH